MDVILPMKVYIKMPAPQLGDRFEKRGDLNYNHKAICRITHEGYIY